MVLGHDSRGNMFVELSSSDYGGKKEFFRITRVEKEIGNPCFRFQIRENIGRLRAMGPEMPIAGFESLIKGLSQLK
ncbi:hypothetical protein ACERII_20300 [Evansella sp. AB-rgal1]|uniref:hypothetical protein n=1 Tax=Evansella sp. AB-rgal1 TaxID=3242696 RepID=UPI00359DB729